TPTGKYSTEINDGIGGSLMKDTFNIGGHKLESRLLIGTGKFGDNRILPEVIEKSRSEIITMAIRRIDIESDDTTDNIISFVPKNHILLPNTSGAHNAEEAVRIARLGRAMSGSNWVKIEIIWDHKYLLPDN